jgi:hypothetical protein
MPNLLKSNRTSTSTMRWSPGHRDAGPPPVAVDGAPGSARELGPLWRLGHHQSMHWHRGQKPPSVWCRLAEPLGNCLHQLRIDHRETSPVQPRTTPGEGRFCRHRGAGGDGIVKERDRQGIVVQQQRQLGARRIRVTQPEPTHV